MCGKNFSNTNLCTASVFVGMQVFAHVGELLSLVKGSTHALVYLNENVSVCYCILPVIVH